MITQRRENEMHGMASSADAFVNKPEPFHFLGIK
jgi:hypothetical protein